MNGTELAVYAGAVLIGCGLAFAAAGGLISWYDRIDRVLKWSRLADAVAFGVAWILALGLAAAAGAVYGGESVTLDHRWKVGALWAVFGAAVSPWFWPRLRAVGLRAITRKAEALVPGDGPTNQVPPEFEGPS